MSLLFRLWGIHVLHRRARPLLSDPPRPAEAALLTAAGPKTVACVLLFNLSRPDFAVDTHVFRLAAVPRPAPPRPAAPAARHVQGNLRQSGYLTHRSPRSPAASFMR